MTESSLNFIGQAPLSQPNDQAQIDVVFIHGLGGDPFTTWQAGEKTQFWPKWLAEDIGSDVNIYTAGYNSTVFTNAFAGEGPSIIDHSTTLLDFLLAKGLGRRKLILITHSLGGLIAKQMLRRCSDAANVDRKRLLDAVSGIIFIGTPHLGAGGATVLKTMLLMLVSKSVEQLKFGDEQLIDLGEWFRNWASTKQMPVAAYYEVRQTKGVQIVGQTSANPYVTGCEPTAVDADHISMAKPASKQSQLYLSALHFIKKQIDTVAPDGTGENNTTSSGNGQSSESICPVVMGEYEYFKTVSPDDRRSLAKKLTDANREHEIRAAERKKDSFARAIEEFGENPSAVARFANILTDVESLFNRHISVAIAKRAQVEEVNDIVQKKVIDHAVTAHKNSGLNSTSALIDDAMYYLTGNCHIRWDNDED